MMADLQVEKHPDKAFIGRRSRGFDFLGYWFSLQGSGGCPEDGGEVFGEGFPALRARCVDWAHWGICGAVVAVLSSGLVRCFVDVTYRISDRT